MTYRAENETGETGRMRRGLTAVIVVLFIAMISLLVLDVRKQLEHLSFATSDNVQWFLGQSETEALSLELAAHQALASETSDLSELQVRFDVFYSRIDTLRSSPTFEPLRTHKRISKHLDHINQFLAKWVAIIDAGDSRFATLRPDFAREASAAQDATRNVALAGIAIFSEIRDAQRNSISQTLTRIAILTIALVTVLIIVVLAMFRLAQIREQDAQTNLEISERMEAIIATALDAVVVTNRDGRIVEYNGAAEAMFGYPRQAALGANIVDLIIPDEFRSMHKEGLSQYHRDGLSNVSDTTSPRMVGPGIVQLEAQNQRGRVFPVELTLARTDSRDGEIFVSFIRDISTRVRAEEAMRDARDRAIAGEKQKADLLAVMSHEMRTPLNGMLGTLDLFEPEKLSKQDQHFLSVMRKSGQILMRHVNDVLDVSRLDAGKMSMQNQSFDLIELLQDIIEGQRARAEARGNELILSPMRPELHDAYNDPDRLRQVLLNLVGNAIKFTENGQVIIEAECHQGLDEVEIRVIDTGLGISQHDLDRVFGDFVTIDSSYARSNTGTGLGLGISQRLVTALGGEMGAESELGEGSVFWLRLPLAPPAEGAIEAPTWPMEDQTDLENVEAPAPMSILLVEDNPTNRMVARQLLERDGHDVTEATDGAEGVAHARNGSFGAILMDISMPGMDGITATGLIRQDDTETPIIATTAHALPTEAARFIGAGMNAVLLKPLTKISLRQTLTKVMSAPFTMIPGLPRSDDLIKQSLLDELLEELPRDQALTLFKKFSSEMTRFQEAYTVGPVSDFETLGTEAHKMAGSAGVFGANRLNLLLRDIQTAAQESQGELPPLLAQITPIWSATYGAFKQLGLITDKHQNLDKG
ncbi:MAG: ATP-binding protein [Pelagimonas sp.]|uniref:ATP-binding protein n=1 Tax=Pelagimonas sp. TaxID=2073170 RepID=UPI003D6BE291